MSTIELLPELGPPSATEAVGWVKIAVAESQMLRTYDGRLFPRSSRAEEIKACENVHALWRRWADQAEALLSQLRPLLESGESIEGIDDLADEIARARAILQLTPEGQARALEQARRGEGIDGRELRREVERRKAELTRSGSRA